LLREGVLDRGQANRIKIKIEDEINQAVDFAKKSPFPAKKEAFSDVYA